MDEMTFERRVWLLELRLACAVLALRCVADATKPMPTHGGGDVRKTMEEVGSRSSAREVADTALILVETHTTPEGLRAALDELSAGLREEAT